MPLWPVAAREARAAARAPRTYAWRAIMTALGIAAIPLALSTPGAVVSPGRAAFFYLSLVAFIYCACGGVLRTCDAIAEEKRENTLGLLFLTDLKAPDVILGKLLASTATLFFCLFAFMPLLAIPLLMGGVTSTQLTFMALCLINCLFLAISCGFLISTIFRQGWITISAGLALMLFYCVLLPLLAENLGEPLNGFFNVLSPTFFFAAVGENAAVGDIWQSFAVTHLLAWIHILYTAKYLPVLWQERPRSARAQLWWDRLTRVRFGGSSARKRFRTRLLNTNPLFWLSGREQVSSGGLMAVLMIVATLSLVTGWREVFVGLFIMHAVLLVRMSSAASHALAEDRKSGALELLLATSLSVRDVLKGRWLALGRQFFGPILIVGIWHIFTILWVRVMGDKNDSTLPLMTLIFALVMAWIATGTFGMWMGLRARHPVAAIWGTLGVVVLLPWITILGVYSLLAAFQMLPDFRFESRAAFISMGIFAWAAYLFLLRAWTSHRLHARFREAATDRYSDTQPIDWRPFRRWTLRIGGATAVTILSIWGIRAWIDASGARELRDMLNAHPEFPITAPPRPYVRPEQNLAEWGGLRPLDMELFRRFTARPGPQWSNMMTFLKWAPLRNWRSGKVHHVISAGKAPDVFPDLEPDLARLHAEAAERPHFLPPRTPNPAAVDSSLSTHNWILFLASRAEVRLLRKEGPVDDILLALRFANIMTNAHESLVSRTHANSLTHVIQPVHDGIRLGVWTDADLQKLQDAFSQIDVFAHYRAWQHHVLRTVTTALTNPPTMANPNLYGNIVHFRWGIEESVSKLPGRRHAQQAHLVRMGLEHFAPIVDAKRRVIDLNVPDERGYYEDRDYTTALTSMMHFHLREGAASLAITEATVQLVVTACAIERYRLAHGKLPAALQELMPKFLAQIPIDVANGNPLVYRREADGYVLYSVALDLQDNGGRPELSEYERKNLTPAQRRNEKPGDWVWVYKP